MKLINLAGMTFNRLTVIERDKTVISKGKKGVYLFCKCQCGTIVSVASGNLKSGGVKSCGCLRNITYKTINHPIEYSAWRAMISRCYAANNIRFCDYGGRGIKVCSEWLNSFEDFYNHVGPRPSPNHSIDRIDNDGNYAPGNVKWSTRKEQCNNKHSNHFLTYNNKTMTMAQWCEQTGLPFSTLKKRIYRGWPVDIALTTPRLDYGVRR